MTPFGRCFSLFCGAARRGRQATANATGISTATDETATAVRTRRLWVLGPVLVYHNVLPRRSTLRVETLRGVHYHEAALPCGTLNVATWVSLAGALDAPFTGRTISILAGIGDALPIPAGVSFRTGEAAARIGLALSIDTGLSHGAGNERA